MKSTLILLSTLAFSAFDLVKCGNIAEQGTNCIAVTCEVMEGKCCDKSSLELKITLAANCGR